MYIIHRFIRDILASVFSLALSSALLFAALFCNPGPAGAEVYRWVDKKGVQHVSNRPPKPSEVKSGWRKSVRKKKLFDLRERVTKVIGVDMIELESGKVVKYIGVEDPSSYLNGLGIDGGLERAEAFHSGLVSGKRVTVLLGKKKRDSKGRYLGHVFLGQETFINAELIREGFALTEEYPTDFEYQSLFVRLLKDAQKKGLGIWKF